MRPTNLSYPRNPDYGTGSCRRLVRVVPQPGRTSASLSDNFHELRCTVFHDSHVVVAITGEAVRIPTTSCPAAAALLQELVGTPVASAARDFYAGGRARQHCTHMFDLAVIAIRASAPGLDHIEYEAEVPDELDRPVVITVRRNGLLVHEWQVRHDIIMSPPFLAGRMLGKGFAAWATQFFDADELEAATILSRTWLIAIGRRYLIERAAGQVIARNEEMIGRCFAYDRTRAVSAVFTRGQTRDALDL